MPPTSSSTASLSATDFATERFRAERSALWFLLPPVLALLAGNAVFALIDFDLPRMAGVVAQHMMASTDPAAVLGEARARYLWSTGLLLYAMTQVLTTALFCSRLRQSLSPPGLRFYLQCFLVLALFGIAQILLASQFSPGVIAVYTHTADSITTAGVLAPDHLTAVKIAVIVVSYTGSVVPALALLAGCTTMVKPTQTSGDALAAMTTEARRLQDLMSAGSALLVTGIIHMYLWLRWPAALVAEPALSAELGGLALSVATYWGCTLSLLIGCFYLPACVVLSRRARAAIAEVPEAELQRDPEAWLKEHGLLLRPSAQLPQLAVILAPLLAGPAGGALTGLASPLGQ
jgi:hypothetical protein